MIEITKDKVDMPGVWDRRYIRECKNGHLWTVHDTLEGNKLRYKGSYEDASIACYNLNKKHYSMLNKGK